ncbi:MAG TPA: aminotransferase class I/II-fold pyridoxal phosphate-dependent enzyme [Phenylobacterium sp.]|uniref:DegT/DnrJ/EryC1/StrS family aminotransferase n=1 Tax=Phenylobacterium sp. TaxID=1871053 RepID=UPI002CF5835B|nr:aminotransferase class I/II-fold pyridoxal phosphate-dependent enzyme [Phenylobacterium sp.]HXA37969.1 aminotransferase class I/II-fold pyridoxal phosphate-dependent enzyme [Phenylobacterium sp.]
MASPPRREEFLPFSRPMIEDDEIAEVTACLRSGWLASGPRVAQFEQMFRERLAAPHAIAVSSATAGLHLALHALGVGRGDEVIVPSLTWVSTANVVELLGARAVLADVDPDTLQLDPAEVRRRLSPRTKAVIPVHFAGAPVDLEGVRQAVRGRPVAIVEDAAHALGAAFAGHEIGSDSAVAVFSFHPTKNITTGEGGMVICADDALAARIRLLRFHGVAKDAWTRHGRGAAPSYEVVEPGYKYNMMDIQAALGLRQLPKLDRFNAERRRLAGRYDELLAGVAQVAAIGRPTYPCEHAWHLYVVRLDLAALRVDRDEVIAALARENIGVGLHFAALHQQAHYRRRRGDGPPLPNATAAAAEILSLPLYPGLADQDQRDVVQALIRVLDANRIDPASPAENRRHAEVAR